MDNGGRIWSEKTIGLKQVLDYWPVPVNRKTVWRWCKRGFYGVVLEHEWRDRQMHTSVEAVARFRAEICLNVQPVYQGGASRELARRRPDW